ncbi:MAG: sulfotransferase domain-containing protein [Candidatus Thorarchaeota archaeon]
MMYSGVGQSNREKIRSLIGNTSIYGIAKAIHKGYAKLTADLHALPNFLIIGAAKSGTSSLYEYLNHHSSILPCVVKEPNYFTVYYDRGLDWYKSCFPFKFQKIFTQGQKFITGEATARYYWYPHAAQRAHRVVPKAKIILLLRNPINRSYSHYKMRFKNKKVKQSFEEEIQNEETNLKGEWEKMLKNEGYFSFKFNSNGYLTKGLYINYIKRWFEFFPKNNILIIKAEDFFSNPEKITNQTFEFLSLPPIKLKRYEIMRKGFESQLKPETRRKLLEYFKPYNEKLYKFLDRDFEWDK